MSPTEQLDSINVRMTPGLKRACDKAAKRAQLTLPDWVRGVLACAANQGAFAPAKGGKKDGKKR